MPVAHPQTKWQEPQESWLSLKETIINKPQLWQGESKAQLSPYGWPASTEKELRLWFQGMEEGILRVSLGNSNKRF